ncbi:cation transporter [uncultured Methanoregula sp.]|uniref:cation diffusion facilitator family transporter n=1 Tax=uncultured Methanoregula sp. TaxID=1005933 RepID=UPI002AAC0F04|nr:cation transporter [uncultured Methanoregula sp.]
MKMTRMPLHGSEDAIHAAEKERESAIFLNLLAAVAPAIPKLAAAVLSGSVTLYASALKTINEAIGVFVSWMIARKIARGDPGIYDYGMGKFENIARIITGSVMLISFVILIFAASYRILVPAPLGSGGVQFGIIIVVIMVAVDAYLSIRSYRIAMRESSPLMDSQWHLFRLKAVANLVVLLTLIFATLCAGLPWAVYIDPVASFAVIGLLFYSGLRMIVASLPDLLDQTLEEELQLVVVKELADHFHNYEQLHGVKSRRSGGSVYVDIFLEFRGDLQMCDIQDIIDRMKISLESKIPKSTVNVITTNSRCKRGRL